ncbi:MAG: hypothetical protein Q7T20_02235 [Saprospiraceae bacterium]|nr:hypothetical protein [Saprospiraceae bacterium]
MLMTPIIAKDSSFSPDSRVWVYTSNRPLTETESAFVQKNLDAFCQQWTAHNQALLAKAEVFENQLLVLMVDETQAGASGCSIDKSVHFLEQLGAEIGADFFERMRFGWVDEQGEMRFSNRPEFVALVREGKIGSETLVVDTLVQTKTQLAEKWLVPASQSWHKRLA